METKDTIQYKWRKDVENRFPDMEQLWVEIQGRDKHSHLLIGTICRSIRTMRTKERLAQPDRMLSGVTISLDGLRF